MFVDLKVVHSDYDVILLQAILVCTTTTVDLLERERKRKEEKWIRISLGHLGDEFDQINLIKLKANDSWITRELLSSKL